jgi:hypothetical protein
MYQKKDKNKLPSRGVSRQGMVHFWYIKKQPLINRLLGGGKVGVAGFEPATSCSQSRRDEPGYATPRIKRTGTEILVRLQK